jgi:hypothetical protein
MNQAETQNAETESPEATEDRLVVEVPAEIRAGRSAVGTGYCLYPPPVLASA